jgi:hypothetical protein
MITGWFENPDTTPPGDVDEMKNEYCFCKIQLWRNKREFFEIRR